MATNILVFGLLLTNLRVQAFSLSPRTTESFHRGFVLHSDLSPSDVGYDEAEDQTMVEVESPLKDFREQRESYKRDLLQLCASYDRGYGASPSAKSQVNELVSQLKELNPTKENAAAGIDGDGGYSSNIPLKGNWRMVWTTALDVLNLGANPVIAPGAIYQQIEPPVATNIIDFIPRIQTLFPSAILPSSLFRAEVTTSTSSRLKESSNRVGLVFESVKLSPIELLGFKSDSLPPLAINFPNINIEELPGVNGGFFDVVYFDDDMLIIQQNAPGGYFVSIRVPDCNP